MFQDQLQLVAGVLRLDGERSYRNIYTQDVSDHVGAKPAHQRGAARGVVGLAVVEEETIHAEAVLSCQGFLNQLCCAVGALEAHKPERVALGDF